MRFTASQGLLLLIAGSFTVYTLVESTGLLKDGEFIAAIFPLVLAVFVLSLTLFLLIRSPSGVAATMDEYEVEKSLSVKTEFKHFAWILGFWAAASAFGFIIGGGLCAGLLARYGLRCSHSQSILVACVVGGVLWLLQTLTRTRYPAGGLQHYLGF